MPKDSKPKEPVPFVEVDHINGYLIPGPDIYVMKRNKSFFNLPEMRMGSSMVEDGNFNFTENSPRKPLALAMGMKRRVFFLQSLIQSAPKRGE